MIQRGDEVLEIFLEETAERLDSIESGLLRLETCGLDCSQETINSIFRDAHSVKAGSNLLKLTNVEDLAHKLENVLEMIRKQKISPSEIIVTACLESVDKLRELIENVERSETISTRLHKHMLEAAVQKTLDGE
ncbi:Hpt domain-containing protein [Pseudodesulfovibrio indicus]|uniref:Two-component system chemotaxis sensor kinase CheA n=1 Tax=Pseudodesulfovibrio indicus TaxID=1716143 RepID=A0AA94PMB2_9BACT|nr:two-component system chemotaxis sensor kinase CheA [Pseudodesulfovibrio indicus]